MITVLASQVFCESVVRYSDASLITLQSACDSLESGGSDSVSLGWGLRFSVSHQFPGEADAAAPQAAL